MAASAALVAAGLALAAARVAGGHAVGAQGPGRGQQGAQGHVAAGARRHTRRRELARPAGARVAALLAAVAAAVQKLAADAVTAVEAALGVHRSGRRITLGVQGAGPTGGRLHLPAAIAGLELLHSARSALSFVAAVLAAVLAAGQEGAAGSIAGEGESARAAPHLALASLAVAPHLDHDRAWGAWARVAELVAAVLARATLGAAAHARADLAARVGVRATRVPLWAANLAAEATVHLGCLLHHVLAAGAAPLAILLLLVVPRARTCPASDAWQVKDGVALVTAPDLCERPRAMSQPGGAAVEKRAGRRGHVVEALKTGNKAEGSASRADRRRDYIGSPASRRTLSQQI